MQCIETKYLCPTNTKSARIKATASGGRSMTVSYDDNLGRDENHRSAMRTLCEKLDWNGVWIEGSKACGNVYVLQEGFHVNVDGCGCGDGDCNTCFPKGK